MVTNLGFFLLCDGFNLKQMVVCECLNVFTLDLFSGSFYYANMVGLILVPVFIYIFLQDELLAYPFIFIMGCPGTMNPRQ